MLNIDSRKYNYRVKVDKKLVLPNLCVRGNGIAIWL